MGKDVDSRNIIRGKSHAILHLSAVVSFRVSYGRILIEKQVAKWSINSPDSSTALSVGFPPVF
jgi:hypothetical protein